MVQAIDVVIFGPPVWAYVWFFEWRGRSGKDAGEAGTRARSRAVLELLSFALAVQEERGHTPGFRRLGLKVIDARTGAEVGFWTAFVRVAVIRAPRYLTKTLVERSRLGRGAEESRRRLKELEPELDSLRTKHEGDRQALHAAIMALYKQEAITPFGGCRPAFVQLAVVPAATFAARRLRDRVNGKTIVVEDR